MPEELPTQGAVADWNKNTKKSLITSTILILFTLLVAIACVVALACTLTQTRVAALVIDGVGVSIPKLDYVGRQWATLRNDGKQLVALEEEDIKSAASLATAGIIAGQKNEALEEKLKVLSYRIEKSLPDFAKELATSKNPERVGRIVGNRDRLIAADESLRSLIQDIEAGYHDVNGSVAQQALLAVQSGQKKSEVELARKRNDQRSSTLFNYIKPDLDKDKDAKARIENAFYELNIDKFECGKNNKECGPIGGLVARGLYHVLTLRPDMLTLALVILMGILGSTLQVSHAYFMKDQAQSLGSYFQRITVGAMTALVIFIVAKAGVPVLADTSRLGGDAPINPYLVSFLAIISGLLSENAIANIQVQGTRFLGTGGGGPKRWARADLTAKLEGQKMSSEELAGHLGVDKSIAEAMLKGTSAMDAQQQKIVALSLRDDPRAIFTDIAPPTASAASTTG